MKLNLNLQLLIIKGINEGLYNETINYINWCNNNNIEDIKEYIAIQKEKESKLYNKFLNICNEITKELPDSLIHDNKTIYNQNQIKIKIYKDSTIRIFKKGKKHITINNLAQIFDL